MQIIQIATASIGEKNAVIFALCKDGTLWKKVVNPSDNTGRNWVLVPPPSEGSAGSDDDGPMPVSV